MKNLTRIAAAGFLASITSACAINNDYHRERSHDLYGFADFYTLTRIVNGDPQLELKGGTLFYQEQPGEEIYCARAKKQGTEVVVSVLNQKPPYCPKVDIQTITLK